INRLMEELDNIANTTSFNGKQLLSGSFINQEFQIGAQSNQSIKASIGATQSSKIGVTRFETGAQVVNSGIASLTIKNYNGIDDFTFQDVVISTSVGTGIGALAEEINKYADKTGVRASFNVQTVGMRAITAGSTGDDFAINGVKIGKIEFQDGDKNGSLVSSINAVKDSTGVEASLSDDGKLVLTSRDGRGISLTGDVGMNTGISPADHENYGRLSLVKNDGRDIAISGTGFGFDNEQLVSQTSVSLRDTKGQISKEIADAMGFNSTKKQIITQALSSWMDANGFGAGTGYSVGSGKDMSIMLASGAIFISSFSQAYLVSGGTGFSAGSGKSAMASLRASTQSQIMSGLREQTAGVTTLKGAMAVMDVAETAITNLDTIRADLGSIQ
ncbi:flagellin hook IN motif-containing protein, partial [Campylobacter sp. US33a]|uniref:flagellin hook IN motif-containing protein n=1 Tax=Campylobacter sp. US33a TaxID=2498120 RepID=UPI001067DD02